ncbi:MAG TPA: hypothetical protein VGJ38_15555 [Jatrophihabitantaceae bacterium]
MPAAIASTVCPLLGVPDAGPIDSATNPAAAINVPIAPAVRRRIPVHFIVISSPLRVDGRAQV